MREIFHESGRLEDSNTKLDEITKLLCLEIASVKTGAAVPSLETILRKHEKRAGIVRALNQALQIAAESAVLTNYDGESFLGPNPKFNISESEDALAAGLMRVVLESFNGHLRHADSMAEFEFMNEAFSHFIRDNFRQNIEDAQYMTPPEVVNYICELGMKRVFENATHPKDPICVCDPSCGVGSFLVQFFRSWNEASVDRAKPVFVGQDKVDRMVRLSFLNTSLYGMDTARLSRGNSVVPGSPLDSVAGKCDLVLTNPPFGARFSCEELAKGDLQRFEMLSSEIIQRTGCIDSELLFLDLYLYLLKPGGTLLAVLPDSVISSSGLPEIVRRKLHRDYSVRSITELPAVTFAQAGTRTKTCVLEVTKAPSKNGSVFLSNAQSLGYEVSSRKGVPYRKQVGDNDLISLSGTIRQYKQKRGSKESQEILSSTPSCVVVDGDMLGESGWTPSHFSADRLSTLGQIGALTDGADFDVLPLSELVSLVPRSRRGVPKKIDPKCISVLHVGEFGSLNMRELVEYRPKIPGRPCSPGDILFSKINPRIPRVLVVPDLPFELTCSNEFEVMRPKDGCTAPEIMLLLLAEHAQNQIRSLTSGTSSSHNRIKTPQLMSVQLVVPSKKSRAKSEYDETMRNFAIAYQKLNEANLVLRDQWAALNAMYGG